jgi:2-polyprenyl-3-methyl-5-hydroxy-6-metoxy-1,4-benzoquinol methylase
MDSKIEYHDRWNFPRLTIASSLIDNDLGYATSGALSASFCLSKFDFKPSYSKTLTILDYGCGTGRVSRPLTPLFKKVIAFDPSSECIKLLKEENEKCRGLSDYTFVNMIATSDPNEIPECDVAICINVIEHLKEEDAEILIGILKKKVKGEVLVAYNQKVKNIINRYLTQEQIEEDSNGAAVRLIDFRKNI